MNGFWFAMPRGILEDALQRLFGTVDIFQIHEHDPDVQPFCLLAKADRAQRTLGDLACFVDLGQLQLERYVLDSKTLRIRGPDQHALKVAT